MLHKPFMLLFVLLACQQSFASSQYLPSFVERMLAQVKEPVLHAYGTVDELLNNAPSAAETSLGSAANTRALFFASPQDYHWFDIPEFRKYQNSHKAPIRFYSGGGTVAVGGAMLIAGYRQDTKYPWSGPSMSLSPLNVFGVLLVIVGLGLITSGWIYYSKYKKHVIAPYNKSY